MAALQGINIQKEEERVVGIYEGNQPGPLFILLGGIHGNEHAGVKAMERLYEMLDDEPKHNPDFVFFGNLVGIKGNLQALKMNTRYINQDLNRILTPQRVEKAIHTPDLHSPEDKEIRGLVKTIRSFIHQYQPEKVIILDLHTTTADGGMFAITSESRESERIAIGLHAPVVRGILTGIGGTTLHYFNSENLGVDTTTIVFESGQHNNPESVNYAISAIVNCLRSAGCVIPAHVEEKHDNLLQEHCKDLPKLVEIKYSHHINEGDDFVMCPGYKNFQSVEKNELLAHDKHGEIRCPMDALILMPLYQKQGTDGFFLVKEVL